MCDAIQTSWVDRDGAHHWAHVNVCPSKMDTVTGLVCGLAMGLNMSRQIDLNVGAAWRLTGQKKGAPKSAPLN